MGYDEFGYGQPPKKRGNGLAFLSVALICLIIGAMGAVLVFSLNNRDTASPSIATSDVPAMADAATPKPDATKAPAAADATDAPAATATAIPDATTAPSGDVLDNGAKGVTFTSDKGPVVDIARDVSPCVVSIHNKTRAFDRNTGFQDVETASGSGVIISSDGYIITNNHVIEDATKLTVTLSTGEEIEAEKVGVEDYTDIAVLKVDRTDLTPVKIGTSADVQVGEMAVAIGNPLGQELYGTVTVGYISGINRSLTVDSKKMTLIQTDAAINPGNSGGALLNMKGELIGINTLKSSSNYLSETSIEGIGFALPIDDVMPLVQELKVHGKIPRAGLNVRGGDITPQMAQYYGYPQGAYIAEVVKDGPADKAGIRVDDIVTKVDGTDVLSYSDLTSYLRGKQIGDKVKITVYRPETKETLEFDVTLEDIN